MQHFIGSDMHTRNQVVAWIDAETGEIRKRRVEHGGEEVRRFYAAFPPGTVVGIEATFPALWFERLLGELGHELWVGDAAAIRASEVRQQKTDPRDAEHLLDLLRTGRFPRIWVPSPAERDLRQLLVHRIKAGSADSLLLRVCGSLFDKHPFLVNTSALHPWLETRKSRRAGSAEVVPFNLCGTLFDKHPFLVNA